MSPTPYRIRDVVERTGASKETVRFYVNEGLLPEPKKTSRNMAWYGDEHIERIQLIRELQEKQFLPLKAIKALLTEAGDYDFTPQQLHAFDVVRRRVQSSRHGQADYEHPLAATLAAYRIEPDEYAEMLQTGLLTEHHGKGGPTLGEEDLRLLQAWAKLRDLGLTRERGFTPRDMYVLQTAVDVLFKQEIQLFAERLGDVSDAESAGVLEKLIPLINEVVGILHIRKIRDFVDNMTEEVDSHAA